MEHRQQPWVHRSWHIRCSRDKGAGAPSEPPRTETSILRKIPTRIPTISSQLASLRSSLTGATLMPHPSTCRNGTFCDTVRRAGKLLGLLLIPRCRDRDPGGPRNPQAHEIRHGVLQNPISGPGRSMDRERSSTWRRMGSTARSFSRPAASFDRMTSARLATST